MTLGVPGFCKRLHTLRDSSGTLVAAAIQHRDGGYRVSFGRGRRLWIGHRRESFFQHPIVVEEAGVVILRFDSSSVIELRSFVPARVLAFLVHLHRVMSEAEAAAATAAIMAIS
jgi:hypothetical protein